MVADVQMEQLLKMVHLSRTADGSKAGCNIKIHLVSGVLPAQTTVHATINKGYKDQADNTLMDNVE